MEQLQQEGIKESRTQKLLRELKTPPDFADPKLPKGFFSHSQYISYLICGKAYEFKYVLQERTPNYSATTRGSAVHSGVEFALKSKMRGVAFTLEQARQVVSDSFDKEAANVTDWGFRKGTGKKPDMPLTAAIVKEEAMKLFDEFTVSALPKLHPTAIEKGFAKKIGDIPMVGWIDLIDELPALMVPNMPEEEQASAPKKRITVDFKTGTGGKWSVNDLRKDSQLTLYAYVEGTPHVRVDQLITYASGPQYVRGESERTPQDAQILIEHLHEVTSHIKKGVFPMCSIDSWACNPTHCSFAHLCRYRKR